LAITIISSPSAKLCSEADVATNSMVLAALARGDVDKEDHWTTSACCLRSAYSFIITSRQRALIHHFPSPTCCQRHKS
jgi:hypothetical protein